MGSEGLFDKILAAKTITEIPRAKKNRVDGPTGAAKWDVTSTENLSLFKNREVEKEVSIVERSRREKEREAKEKRRGKVS